MKASGQKQLLSVILSKPLHVENEEIWTHIVDARGCAVCTDASIERNANYQLPSRLFHVENEKREDVEVEGAEGTAYSTLPKIKTIG